MGESNREIMSPTQGNRSDKMKAKMGSIYPREVGSTPNRALSLNVITFNHPLEVYVVTFLTISYFNVSTLLDIQLHSQGSCGFYIVIPYKSFWMFKKVLYKTQTPFFGSKYIDFEPPSNVNMRRKLHK